MHDVLPPDFRYSCVDDVKRARNVAHVYIGPFIRLSDNGSMIAIYPLVDIVGSDALMMYVPGGTVTFCVSCVPHALLLVAVHAASYSVLSGFNRE